LSTCFAKSECAPITAFKQNKQASKARCIIVYYVNLGFSKLGFVEILKTNDYILIKKLEQYCLLQS
jgi:hypothetical protein